MLWPTPSCGVLDLLVSIGKDGQVDPSRLGDLIVRHLAGNSLLCLVVTSFFKVPFFHCCSTVFVLPCCVRCYGCFRFATSGSNLRASEELACWRKTNGFMQRTTSMK